MCSLEGQAEDETLVRKWNSLQTDIWNYILESSSLKKKKLEKKKKKKERKKTKHSFSLVSHYASFPSDYGHLSYVDIITFFLKLIQTNP